MSVEIAAQTDQIVVIIEAQIVSREAARLLKEMTEQLNAFPDDLTPTPQEIGAEIRAN